MRKLSEGLVVYGIVWIFAFLVAVLGYFWASDEFALAVAFVVMAGLSAIGFYKWKESEP